MATIKLINKKLRPSNNVSLLHDSRVDIHSCMQMINECVDKINEMIEAINGLSLKENKFERI